jgi:hypothetical protein
LWLSLAGPKFIGVQSMTLPLSMPSGEGFEADGFRQCVPMSIASS